MLHLSNFRPDLFYRYNFMVVFWAISIVEIHVVLYSSYDEGFLHFPPCPPCLCRYDIGLFMTCHEDEPQHSVGRGQCHNDRNTVDKEGSEGIPHHKKNTKQHESQQWTPTRWTLVPFTSLKTTPPPLTISISILAPYIYCFHTSRAFCK